MKTMERRKDLTLVFSSIKKERLFHDDYYEYSSEYFTLSKYGMFDNCLLDMIEIYFLLFKVQYET